MLVALPWGGLSASLVEMLGPRHVHRDAIVGDIDMESWRDFRRSSVAEDVQLHVIQHTHGLFERHHHDRADATVVALDGHESDAAGGDADAVLAFVVFVAATSNDLELPVASDATASWPDRISAAFSSCDGCRLERPPQA